MGKSWKDNKWKKFDDKKNAPKHRNKSNKSLEILEDNYEEFEQNWNGGKNDSEEKHDQ